MLLFVHLYRKFSWSCLKTLSWGSWLLEWLQRIKNGIRLQFNIEYILTKLRLSHKVKRSDCTFFTSWAASPHTGHIDLHWLLPRGLLHVCMWRSAPHGACGLQGTACFSVGLSRLQGDAVLHLELLLRWPWSCRAVVSHFSFLSFHSSILSQLLCCSSFSFPYICFPRGTPSTTHGSALAVVGIRSIYCEISD